MSLSTEKHILCNTEMVKAILEGRKTQTRRAIQIVSDGYNFNTCPKNVEKIISWTSKDEVPVDAIIKTLSKYKTGDILWVREPAKVINYDFPSIGDILNNEAKAKDWVMWYKYLADDKENEIVIPERFIYDCTIQAKWITDCQGVPNECIEEMARIFLKVTNVRVERLQNIKHIDILKEGFNKKSENNAARDWLAAQLWWSEMWNSTAKDGYKWEDNPYVFVYEFERITND